MRKKNLKEKKVRRRKDYERNCKKRLSELCSLGSDKLQKQREVNELEIQLRKGRSKSTIRKERGFWGTKRDHHAAVIQGGVSTLAAEVLHRAEEIDDTNSGENKKENWFKLPAVKVSVTRPILPHGEWPGALVTEELSKSQTGRVLSAAG